MVNAPSATSINVQIAEAVYLSRELQHLIDTSWAPLPAWKETRMNNSYNVLRGRIQQLSAALSSPEASFIQRAFIRNLSRTLVRLHERIKEFSPAQVSFYVVPVAVVQVQRPFLERIE